LVGQADPPCERSFRLRHGKQMDMVIHKAIGPDLKVVFFSIYSQQFQVCQAIFVIKKDYSAIITTLRDVMWMLGSYDTCDSWHGMNNNVKT
jgi:hypothetical protein